MRFALALLVFIALFSLSACALSDLPNGNVPNSAGVWEGNFSYGFETVMFKPCRINEQWWVTGEGGPYQDLYARYNQIAPHPYGAVYVRLRGTAGAKGTFGHLGGYQREFQVKEVLEVRVRQTGDCD